MLIDIRVLRRRALRALAGGIFVLAFTGAASAQNLNCPVASNVNISGTTTNVTTTCLIDLGIVANVLSNGTLNNEGPHGYDGTLLNEGTLVNGGTINNFCIFGLGGNLCNGGSAQDTIYNALSTLINVGEIKGGVVLNTGLIDNLPGGSLNGIILTNAVGGTVKNVGDIGIPYVNSPTTSTNNGMIESFSGGTIEINNQNGLPGVLTNNAILINDAGATITNSGVLTNSLGATFTNNGAFTNGTFSNGMVNGRFENDGTFTNNGTLTGSGSFFNNGKVNNAPSDGVFSNFGNAGISILNNYGQITNEASGSMGIGGTSISSSNFGTLTNNGQLFIEDDLDNRGQLANNGTLTIEGGSLTIEPGRVVVNTGSIVVNPFDGEGGLIIGPASTLTNAAGSSFLQIQGNTFVYGTLNSVPAVQLAGGALLGTGTINGNVNNTGGIVQPGVQPANVNGLVPGTLTINGNYTQGSDGLLDIELLGNAPGGFSVLDVSGLVTLDGTLDFFAFPGFNPQVGEDFTFLLFGSLSGKFANIDFDGWSCPIGDVCDVIYGAKSISLDIEAMGTGGNGGDDGNGGGGGISTPEPSSPVLVVTGIFAIAIFSRRKRGTAIA